MIPVAAQLDCIAPKFGQVFCKLQVLLVLSLYSNRPPDPVARTGAAPLLSSHEHRRGAHYVMAMVRDKWRP